MTPRIKPRKGWRFRIIIVNESGKYEYDDFNQSMAASEIAMRLLADILKREASTKWKKV